MTEQYSKKAPRMISDIRILISMFLQEELKDAGLQGVVPSHGEILYNLVQNGDMTMTELSNAITKDRSTVTALVSKLIKKGMAEYVENPEDMRSKKVRLTSEGKLFEARLNGISDKMNKKFWENISEDEKKAFIKVLRKIHGNFENT